MSRYVDTSLLHAADRYFSTLWWEFRVDLIGICVIGGLFCGTATVLVLVLCGVIPSAGSHIPILCGGLAPIYQLYPLGRSLYRNWRARRAVRRKRERLATTTFPAELDAAELPQYKVKWRLLGWHVHEEYTTFTAAARRQLPGVLVLNAGAVRGAYLPKSKRKKTQYQLIAVRESERGLVTVADTQILGWGDRS